MPILNRWLYVLLLLVAVGGILGGCRARPNGNLKLLLGEARYGLNCVVSHDFRIYYLRHDEAGSAGYGSFGTLWVTDIDRYLLDKISNDTFSALAIDTSGSRLALIRYRDDTGRVLIYHRYDQAWDTIQTRFTDLMDVRFGRRSPGDIYISSSGQGIFRTDTLGRPAELVDSTARWAYFDVTANDSVVWSFQPRPAVDPSGCYVAFASWRSEFDEDIALVKFATGETTWLHANPWEHSWVRWPAWYWRDGLVFSTQEIPEGLVPYWPINCQIWRLDNVELP